MPVFAAPSEPKRQIIDLDFRFHHIPVVDDRRMRTPFLSFIIHRVMEQYSCRFKALRYFMWVENNRLVSK